MINLGEIEIIMIIEHLLTLVESPILSAEHIIKSIEDKTLFNFSIVFSLSLLSEIVIITIT